MRAARLGLVATLVVALVAVSPTAGQATPPAYQPPANPYLGPVGTATMHGDSEASDSTPNTGPGTGTVLARYTPLIAACPTILQGSDGYVQALCTTIANQTPTAFLLDPSTGLPITSLALTKGALLGGVYAFLDSNNQLVAADGDETIVRIGHDHGGLLGTWRLFVAQTYSVAAAIDGQCGSADCDAVSSVNPDYSGRIWFSTTGGIVGFVDPTTGAAKAITLGTGEHIDNSISSGPQGVAVTTDHALYLVGVDGSGNPTVLWRQAYDRGPSRKPGQLSWGSGSTPTFFGPTSGTEYLTITDNSVPQEHLDVYNTADGSPVCSVAVLPVGASGTENSPIGSNRSVYVASTYGYPYPTTPADSGPADPATADFIGGMTRVDVNAAGNGCTTVWTNTVHSAAVPRLSTTSGQITTIARANPFGGNSTTYLDTYSYEVVDANTGAVRDCQLVGIGIAWDTLQTVGTIDANHVYYQGTITGLMRISTGS
jgi:hypothetical protein